MIYYSENERPDILLAKDRQEGIKRDNFYLQQTRSFGIPSPEPSSDSWLNVDSLCQKIEAAIDLGRNSIDCSNWVEALPSAQKIEEICDEAELILGLEIDFESRINFNNHNLLIYWE